MKIPKNVSSGGGCMRTPISPWPNKHWSNFVIGWEPFRGVFGVVMRLWSHEPAGRVLASHFHAARCAQSIISAQWVSALCRKLLRAFRTRTAFNRSRILRSTDQGRRGGEVREQLRESVPIPSLPSPSSLPPLLLFLPHVSLSLPLYVS